MTDPVIAPERRGRCLELAGRHVMHHDATLIHGSVVTDDTDGNPITIFHAWTEQADGLVYDAVLDTTFTPASYSALFGAATMRRYTKPEMAAEMIRHNHWGPWHPDTMALAEASLARKR